MKITAIRFNIVFLLISFCAVPQLQSQKLTATSVMNQSKENNISPQWEEIYLHIDRDRYIAGEDLWFSIYSTDTKTGKLSSGSTVAYIELLSPWNNPVIQARFQLSGGRGQGNLTLPDSISSGTYTVRAYTNWMKNFLPYYCFSYDIDIYNPFKGSGFWRKTDRAGSPDESPVLSPDKNEIRINLRTDSVYGRREKVSLNILIANEKAGQSGPSEMSISVAPAETSGTSRRMNNYILSEAVPERYNFESDGHFLSGNIKYREGDNSDSTGFLFMSVQGKIAEFRYAAIDTAGHFSFVLPVDSKFRNLILQPEHANENMILEIEPSFSRILPASSTYKDTIPDSQTDLFSVLSFNYQVAKIYGLRSKKDDEMIDSRELKMRRFYGIPEMEIFLDDYIRLPSMEEVFIELLPGVILRSGKSGYEIKITNPLTGIFYNEPPLVMIDGVIINDLTVVADLDPEIVEKIEVVKTPYLIEDLILNGIINVITRSGNFSNITMPDYAVILPYRVADTPALFIHPDHSADEDRLSRLPDLRNTLYWNPSVKTNRNGEAIAEFWTSDLPGVYSIRIEGISATGQKLSMNKSFIVR